MKTNKSYTKRLKVTRRGKILARKPGQNHFNAKETGQRGHAKKNMVSMKFTNKDRSRFLSSK
jgi:ribosomal protein L35